MTNNEIIALRDAHILSAEQFMSAQARCAALEQILIAQAIESENPHVFCQPQRLLNAATLATK